MKVINSVDGLTEQEANSKLKDFGYNELPLEKKKKFWVQSTLLLREPMIVLLLITAALYLIIGDIREGLLLGLSVFVVLFISIYQEQKSARALAALKELSSPRALVIRDGVEKRVEAKLLVPGDFISLHEGDRIPADGTIVEATNLTVDESLLTGESFAVKKGTKDAVFSSTLVISGIAIVEIEKTGAQTEIGKIGKSLQEAEPDDLNLSKEVRQLVVLFAWSGALICLLFILLFGFMRGDWIQAILIGLATEMALLPEEFPVVLTIFMAMGAWRLSKLKVLVRHPNAIERLGAISVLCVDKTGTLTQNRMTVTQLHNGSSPILLPPSADNLLESFHEIIEYGILASQIDPFDPMEKAIRLLAEQHAWGKEHLHEDWELVRDYPLSDKLLAMSSVWKKTEQSQNFVIATKGAPEAIMELCRVSSSKREEIVAAVREMASSGLRVLAVAKSTFAESNLPKDPHDFSFEWLGLLGLEDPLRSEVPEAVQLCRRAGIRVIMMTGDYPETAIKIAGQAGLDNDGPVITGAEIEKLTDSELVERLKIAHVFARMIPSQKLRIVKALKNLGHVVGMTGDGVNDAPSLRWADVGIAMGARGTDVAREASDIVLLDDNFTSIVAGIERGRFIFSNIKKAMGYVAAVHVPIAGLAVLPVILGWPLILLPAHIVFLEIVIDPVCSLLFESQGSSRGLMDYPPRSLKHHLFTLPNILRSFLQGALILIACSSAYYFILTQGSDNSIRARTIAFGILTMSNLGLIFADISGGSFTEMRRLFRNPINSVVALSVISIFFLGSQIPWLNDLFKLGYLSTKDIGTVFGFSISIFVIISVWNRIQQKNPITNRDSQTFCRQTSIPKYDPKELE